MKHNKENAKKLGVPALHNEGYASPKKAERSIQKQSVPWWSRSLFIIFTTAIFSFMDAMVLYSIFDLAFKQSAILSYLVSGGIALLLNMLPLAISHSVFEAEYRLKRHAAVYVCFGIVTFAALYAGTVYVRFLFQDIYDLGHSDILLNTAAMSADVLGTADPAGPHRLSHRQRVLLRG